jgi:tripartite-type tricarboxylate transporter receptor subunit TctC
MQRIAVLGVCLGLSLLAVDALGASARAEDYPVRPVTFVVPYPPAGGADILTRMLAEELRDKLKQPFVVENRPGAGTLIGAAAVAKSPPDGYTLLLAPVTTLAINPSVYKSLPYDPVKDFAPVGLVGSGQFVLVVSPALGVASLSELIALVRKKPGEMDYASAGLGTPHHLFMEMFLKMAGLNVQHIPYRGSVPALDDVMAGEVPLMMVDLAAALPLIRDGRVKALGVTTPARVAAAPDIPTIAEAGLPGYSASGWISVVARAGTPRSTIDKLDDVLRAYLGRADVQERFLALAIEPFSSTPDELAAYIATETGKWAQVVKDAGIRAE